MVAAWLLMSAPGGVAGEDDAFVGRGESGELAQGALEAVDAAALVNRSYAIDVDDDGDQSQPGVFLDDPVFSFGVVEIQTGVFEAS